MSDEDKSIQDRIAELAADYDVDEDGTIHSPGKFEGEDVIALYLHALVMGGAVDEEINGTDGAAGYDVFILDEEDDLRAACPWLAANDVAFVTWTSESGFFNVETVTQGQLDKLRADCEEAAGPGEEDITVTPDGDAYCNGKRIAPAKDGARDDAAIRAWMDRGAGYYPNVWQQDDHGGATLVTVAED
jgi:hypothetical protein